MAKRPVKKKSAKKSVVKHKYPCKIHGPKSDCTTAYMRVEKSGNAGDGRSHYCAEAWRKHVEGPRRIKDRETVARIKKNASGGLKDSAERASASKKPRRVVKKK